ncbi:biotin--[acetyl-CoA-carboxylase] ligase [Muriicola sp.]|uniref:biotin--[acetyl-CoA-carboxylase] ligase n=1 Tax=Muriicola sp. TaxID=2020856 RepID=UPI003C768F5C
MKLIKVSATDSTNLHLKRMLQDTPLEDYTVLVAEKQLQGRGQGRANWASESGKNLTFSVLKYYKELQARDQFFVSMAVSIGIYKALSSLQIPELSIKWPNDILSGRKKLCGILIENIVKGSFLKNSILGIGLNVNQESFDSLPNAASLKQITAKHYEPDVLLIDILLNIKKQMEFLEDKKLMVLEKEYQQQLFRKDIPAIYTVNGIEIEGTIRGVNKEGQLLLEQESLGITAYGFKEIAYCY